MINELYYTFKVGTVLRIGHPANGVAWIKMNNNDWRTNHGKMLNRDEMFDTLEHGAFQLLVGGK